MVSRASAPSASLALDSPRRHRRPPSPSLLCRMPGDRRLRRVASMLPLRKPVRDPEHQSERENFLPPSPPYNTSGSIASESSLTPASSASTPATISYNSKSGGHKFRGAVAHDTFTPPPLPTSTPSNSHSQSKKKNSKSLTIPPSSFPIPIPAPPNPSDSLAPPTEISIFINTPLGTKLSFEPTEISFPPLVRQWEHARALKRRSKSLADIRSSQGSNSRGVLQVRNPDPDNTSGGKDGSGNTKYSWIPRPSPYSRGAGVGANKENESGKSSLGKSSAASLKIYQEPVIAFPSSSTTEEPSLLTCSSSLFDEQPPFERGDDPYISTSSQTETPAPLPSLHNHPFTSYIHHRPPPSPPTNTTHTNPPRPPRSPCLSDYSASSLPVRNPSRARANSGVNNMGIMLALSTNFVDSYKTVPPVPPLPSLPFLHVIDTTSQSPTDELGSFSQTRMEVDQQPVRSSPFPPPGLDSSSGSGMEKDAVKVPLWAKDQFLSVPTRRFKSRSKH